MGMCVYVYRECVCVCEENVYMFMCGERVCCEGGDALT